MEYGDYYDESSTEDGQFEIARILGEEFSLPKELAEVEAIFNEFFSLQSYQSLTPAEQENILKCLPKFVENDAEEKEETLKRLLNRENFHFSSPLTTFQNHLHNGYFRPDIADLRALMKKGERRQYNEQQKRFKYRLLKEILVERRDLLETVYNSPPGPLKFSRHYVSNNPAGDPLKQKVKKRYYQELAAVRSEVGEFSQSSEDEIYQDRAPRTLAKKQKQKLIMLEGSLMDSDMQPVLSTLSTKPSGFDLEAHVTNTSNPYEINDDMFKKMLATHRKRRVAMDTHPNLNTYGLKIKDIALRTGCQYFGQKRTNSRSGSNASSVHTDRNSRKKHGRSKTSSDVNIQFDTNLSFTKRIKKEIDDELIKASDDSSEEEISSALDQNETDKCIDVENSSPTNIPQNQKLMEREQNKIAELPAIDNSMIIDVMNLPANLKDDTNFFSQKSDLMQDTHSCFFSLLRDIICSSVQHRMTLDKMYEKLRMWETNPISPLNEWFSVIKQSWTKMVDSALNFLSGHYEVLPDDFVPYIEYKPSIRSYQWIGAGRDSDSHLATLCSHWIERHSNNAGQDRMSNNRANQQQQTLLLPQNTEDPELLEDIDVDDADDDIIDFDTPADVEVPPPRCTTTWKVRPSTEEEKLAFQAQERERFMNPTKAFTYRMHDYESIVGPVKGIYNSQTTGSVLKPRGHNLLSTNRPSYVTVLALVKDAAARLPNGEGTRADICTLIRDSQYLDLSSAQDNTLQSVVSGALDRLHGEVDACIKFDTKRKLWVYLHRRRSEQEMEKMHQQMQGKHVSKSSRKNNRKKPSKVDLSPTKETESLNDKRKGGKNTVPKVTVKIGGDVGENKEEKGDVEKFITGNAIRNVKGKQTVKLNAETQHPAESRTQEIITSSGKKILIQTSLPGVSGSRNPATLKANIQNVATIPQKVISKPPQQQQQQLQQSTLLKPTIATTIPSTVVTTISQSLLTTVAPSSSSSQRPLLTTGPSIAVTTANAVVNTTVSTSQFITANPIHVKNLPAGTQFVTSSGQKVQIISSSTQSLGQIQSIQLANGQSFIAHGEALSGNQNISQSNLITNLQNLQQMQILTSTGQLLGRAINVTSAPTFAIARTTDSSKTTTATTKVTTVNTSVITTPNANANARVAMSIPAKNIKNMKVVTSQVANAMNVTESKTGTSLLPVKASEAKDDSAKGKIAMIQKSNSGKLPGQQVINVSSMQLVNAPLTGKSPASILTGVKLVNSPQGVKMVPTSSTIVQSALHGSKVAAAAITTKSAQSSNSIHMQVTTAQAFAKQQSNVVTTGNQSIKSQINARTNAQIISMDSIMQGIKANATTKAGILHLPINAAQFAVVSQANLPGHPRIIQTQQFSTVANAVATSQSSPGITTISTNPTRPTLANVRAPTNVNFANIKPVILAKAQSQQQNVIMATTGTGNTTTNVGSGSASTTTHPTLVLSQQTVSARSGTPTSTAAATAAGGTVQCVMQPATAGAPQQIILPASALSFKGLQGLKMIPFSSPTGQKVYARLLKNPQQQVQLQTAVKNNTEGGDELNSSKLSVMGLRDESDCEDMDRGDSDSEKERDREKSTEREASSERHTDNGESDESDLDETEYDRRKTECIDMMSDLEKQFAYLRDILHRERYLKVDNKLFEIRSGRAVEYLQPVQQLQENMKVRTEVAGLLKQFALTSIHHQFEAEKMAALQNLQSEQKLLMDSMVDELENEIKRLEEDRNNLDVSTALWGEEQPRRGGSRKKPITVTGPYIVYMLSDSDILHDWTIIKKALSANKRKSSVHL